MHTNESLRIGGALRGLAGLAAALLLPGIAWAGGIPAGPPASGSVGYTLTARDGYVSTPDGGSLYAWGYADGSGAMQFPGPTLAVEQGTMVTVTLNNALPAAAGSVSLVFPGQDVTAGGAPGLLTREALPGRSATYSFVADRPGTYLYHSGTRPELQIEMGLVGALIVYPADGSVCASGLPAYDNANTCYDREYLFLLSEMDVEIHDTVESQAAGPGPIVVATTPYDPEYWFINGRAAPDTMGAPGTALLAHQPYDAMVMMEPGERVLMRVVGAGREPHPFHHHGNHSRILARDANLVADPTTGALLGPTVFTITSVPGGTADAIFQWTGKGLGWDIYGHAPGDTLEPSEWAPDHGKPIPVQLPDGANLTVGGFWSGSPFMGADGPIPPGEGGLNPYAGFTFMWHSHTEREMVNNDIFPGGLMTMLLIAPPGALAGL